MKGPSLQYDLRVLRIFHCDGCGREAQVPAGVTSHTCPCTDPPKFMRPLERVRVTSPDVTAFLSVPDPSELVEETVEVEEPYVPYIPPMPPKRVQFPNRRRLSDDIDKFQPAEFGDGVDSQNSEAGNDASSSVDSNVVQPRRNDPRERPQRPRRAPLGDHGTAPQAEPAPRNDSPDERRPDRRPEQRPASSDRPGRPERPDRSERSQGQQRKDNSSSPRSQESSTGSQPRGARPNDASRGATRPSADGPNGDAVAEGSRSQQGRRRSRNRNGQRQSDSGAEENAIRPDSKAPVVGSLGDDFGSGIDSERNRNQPLPMEHESMDDFDVDGGGETADGAQARSGNEAGPRRKNRRRGRRRGRGPGPSSGGGSPSSGPSDSGT